MFHLNKYNRNGIYCIRLLPVWFNGNAQKISNCSGKIVLKNNRLVLDSFAGDVTYAITSLRPKIFVMTRRAAI